MKNSKSYNVALTVLLIAISLALFGTFAITRYDAKRLNEIIANGPTVRGRVSEKTVHRTFGIGRQNILLKIDGQPRLYELNESCLKGPIPNVQIGDELSFKVDPDNNSIIKIVHNSK